jgi:Protein of unknown function (DUF1580)
MLDLRNEEPITLAAAAKMFPPTRQGRPISLSAIFRWISDGIKGPDGTRIRLEAARVGGRWLTSVAALERFAMAQTPRFGGEETTMKIRTLGQRQRASEAAARELEKAGI